MRRIPKFEDNWNYSVLRCPECDSPNLHQVQVEAFFREQDSQEGIHATVNTSGVKVDMDMAGNPSDRRAGLRILFMCELCSAEDVVLCIVQHKGDTMVYFEDYSGKSSYAYGERSSEGQQ